MLGLQMEPQAIGQFLRTRIGRNFQVWGATRSPLAGQIVGEILRPYRP